MPKLIVIGAIAAFALFMVGGARAATTVVVKASDESVTSNVTPQNDDELFFATSAGVTYWVELYLIFGSPAGGGTPDLRFNFAEDGTSRGWFSYITYNLADSSHLQQLGHFSNGGDLAAGSAAADRVLSIKGTVIGNGGTVQLKWSQWTSNGNPLIVRAGSTLRYGPVSDPAATTTSLDDLSDVDTTGALDGTVIKYDEDTSTWLVATDEAGGGSSGPVTLSAGDRERLDLAWWGVWALVGLALLALIAPAMYRLLDVRQGMGGRFERG